MSNFLLNLRKFKSYIFYSAKASLKADVSGSYLNWLWWILEPLLFMLVYRFVHNVVFSSKEPHFTAFIFCGYGTWSFFQHCVSNSVKLVRSNKSILSRIYLPKYVLMGSCVIEYFYRYLITVALTIITAVLDNVQFTWNILWFPVIVLFMVFFTFSVSLILLHIGVYINDLNNVINILLRLVFYMSGIFYNLENRVPKFGRLLCQLNPVAMYVNELRKVIIYATEPDWILLFIWLVVSFGLLIFGVRLIEKYERTYIKAV